MAYPDELMKNKLCIILSTLYFCKCQTEKSRENNTGGSFGPLSI